MSTRHTAEDERIQPTRATTGTKHVVLADFVRQMMAECRARLVTQDAAGELERDAQAARACAVERAAAD